jgi:hypothetical protein
VNSHVAIETARPRARRSPRAVAVSALGPLTVLAGLVWAFVQPYRVTLLHPRGESFWWLVVEPPLLVMAVGVAFALLVVPGLLEDLAAAEEEGR